MQLHPLTPLDPPLLRNVTITIKERWPFHYISIVRSWRFFRPVPIEPSVATTDSSIHVANSLHHHLSHSFFLSFSPLYSFQLLPHNNIVIISYTSILFFNHNTLFCYLVTLLSFFGSVYCLKKTHKVKTFRLQRFQKRFPI